MTEVERGALSIIDNSPTTEPGPSIGRMRSPPVATFRNLIFASSRVGARPFRLLGIAGTMAVLSGC
jgi:hypothetical protein